MNTIEEKKFKNSKEEIEFEVLDFSSLKKGEIVLVTIKKPPLTMQQQQWIQDLYKREFFGKANLLVVPEGIEITRENVKNIIQLEDNNGN